MDRLTHKKKNSQIFTKNFILPSVVNEIEVQTSKKHFPVRTNSFSNIRQKNLTPPSSNHRISQLFQVPVQSGPDLQKKILQLQRKNSQIQLKYSQDLLKQVQDRERLQATIKNLQKEKIDKENELFSNNIQLLKQLKQIKTDLSSVIQKLNTSLGALKTCIQTWCQIEYKIEALSLNVVQSFSCQLKYKLNGILAKYDLNIQIDEPKNELSKTATFHQLSDYFETSLIGITTENSTVVKPGELVYREGDAVEVITSNQDGWCFGKIQNQIGVIPRNHLKFDE